MLTALISYLFVFFLNIFLARCCFFRILLNVCVFVSNTVNFQDWTVINVPGQGSLDLNTFLCKQPVTVVVYDFTAANTAGPHKARCGIAALAPVVVVLPGSDLHSTVQ